MTLYEKFYPLALDMLTKYGAGATLIRTAPRQPTQAEMLAGQLDEPAEPQGEPVLAIMANVPREGIDGRQETQSTVVMLVEPAEGDTLLLGSYRFTIGTVSAVAPQGEAIVYMAQVA